MRMYDLIVKKRNGNELTKEDIHDMIEKYLVGDILDCQMSAMLMAIYFMGMTDDEIGDLTNVMAHSGEVIDLSNIEGIKVDKHSTGGVGDKTTLIVAPIVAACGVKVAKMSGRGLGHTGGTLDKMESIPNMKINLTKEEFFQVVNKVGFSVIGQTVDIAPADKKLYALRDITGTIESIPLIAASIMSKKLAAGSDCIVLDVKTGSGAFMKTMEDAILLSQKMVAIGEHVGKKTIALITDMDTPLGYAIGNALELKEVVDTLKGKGPKDLTEVSISLAANMLYLAGKGTMEECERMAKKTIEDNSAYERLVMMVEAHGGDIKVIEDTSLFGNAPYIEEITAPLDGYITHMDAEEIGSTSVILGAGRETMDSKIDYLAGIVLKKKTGDYVEEEEVIAELHTSDKALLPAAKELFYRSITIGDKKPDSINSIYARVEKDNIKYF